MTIPPTMSAVAGEGLAAVKEPVQSGHEDETAYLLRDPVLMKTVADIESGKAKLSQVDPQDLGIDLSAQDAKV